MKKYTYVEPRRAVGDEDRENLLIDFPEIDLIGDPELRKLSIEAWCFALSCSDFRRIIDIPPEGNPGQTRLQVGTQADHLRGVVRLSAALAKEFSTAWPQVVIDHDILMAGAVCHDVGKPYEFDPENRARWKADGSRTGDPTFRHSVFGMHVCLKVGLPVEVAHIAVGHSFEGLQMGVSSECLIVRQADHDWWQLAGALGLVTPETMSTRPANVRARLLKK
ncbi:HD domain-containing protein [Rhizobium sp. S152]|uniref:HD domain-containing protein n=1 Tax=Rhizobium sp. S152 TaxID=3055038 RepID=UPI0025A9F087|nr:HD domain-containing protein [Rhizobium sp. S152]MDM9628014.1 HD domain-containing protein [Rhizobium sp. S152]